MVASFKRRCLFIRRKLACALFVDNDHVFSVCVISCGLLRYSRCESVDVKRVYLLLRVATVFEGLDAAVVQCWAKLLSHVAILILALVSLAAVDSAKVLRLRHLGAVVSHSRPSITALVIDDSTCVSSTAVRGTPTGVSGTHESGLA